jgi:enoyl-CoA hydratase
MRQERIIQATIFEVFAEHEIGRELKAISQWLDEHRGLPRADPCAQRLSQTGAAATRTRRSREERRGGCGRVYGFNGAKAAEEGRIGPAPSLIEACGGLSAGGATSPAWLRSSQRPPLSQRSRSCHPGSAARRLSIHSGVTPDRVASSSRPSAFVWVKQGITAGASPSIGRLIFNNPARYNAVSLEMWQAVTQIMDDFEQDDAVRVIVVSGAGGRAFVAGADISEFKERRAAAYSKISEGARMRLQETLKPTIAMIRGYCIGVVGGTALACDLRIAAEGSKFGVPAAKLGLGYAYDGIKRLIDLVGPAYAREIFFTARQFTAEEALRMGLVNQVVLDGELESFVGNYCDLIAANAPLTVRSAKVSIREALKDESTRDLVLCKRLVDECFASADYAEGRTAFMEKRKPVFKGR